MDECMHGPVVSLDPALAGWLCDMKEQRELIDGLIKRVESLEAGIIVRVVEPEKAALRYVVSAMAVQYQVSEKSLIGPCREARLVEARHLAFYLCRYALGASYADISRMFKRDHCGVMYGCRAMADRIAVDRKMARLAEAWMEKIKSVHQSKIDNNNNNGDGVEVVPTKKKDRNGDH